MAVFYHATTEAKWEQIQKDGYLFGSRNAPSGCTYLATKKKDVVRFGKVILRVQYEPDGKNDNYTDGAWQCRVYVPIGIACVERT